MNLLDLARLFYNYTDIWDLQKTQPKYVFRGTTVLHPGSENARTIPYTCTSWHPVKALWFALACLHQTSDDAVVYVARTEMLSDFSIIYNTLKKIEDEIGFQMKPADFYRYCDGYIYVADLQKLLQGIKINAYNVARIDNLTRLCKETENISEKSIQILVNEIQPYLKKS